MVYEGSNAKKWLHWILLQIEQKLKHFPSKNYYRKALVYEKLIIFPGECIRCRLKFE